MRHLELHIKRQPGVFLHSWVNWSLSLMLCMSLKWQMPWFFPKSMPSLQSARFKMQDSVCCQVGVCVCLFMVRRNNRQHKGSSCFSTAIWQLLNITLKSIRGSEQNSSSKRLVGSWINGQIGLTREIESSLTKNKHRKNQPDCGLRQELWNKITPYFLFSALIRVCHFARVSKSALIVSHNALWKVLLSDSPQPKAVTHHPLRLHTRS